MTEIEPISPKEARAILDAAIVARLGTDWDDEHEGWTLVSGHDYMARLTKGEQSIDFYVDLLGNVTVEEDDSAVTTNNGRLIALMLFIASSIVAIVIARISGYL